MTRTRGNLASRLGSLALAGASIVFTLGACEIALRMLGYEAIYDVYSHPEIFWRKDPLLGWAHEPNSQDTYVGPRPWPVEFEARVEINSLGLRGPEIAALPPEGYRVMLLGDSMVAGFEVPWKETFAARIEALLRAEFQFPVQVINAGVRGYGTDQSYLYYKERGQLLKPDLVIFLHGGNDEADDVTLHRMRRLFGKGALAPEPDGDLRQVGYPIPDYPLCSEWLLDSRYEPRRVDTPLESSICRAQTLLADRSALFTFFSQRIQQSPRLLIFLYQLGSPASGAERLPAMDPVDPGGDPADVAPRTELTAAIMRALAREVRSRGSELMLVVIPAFWPDLDPRDFVSDAVTTFEIRDDLDQDVYHYVHDSHLSPRGHELVAKRLAPAIAERIRASRSRLGSPVAE